MSDFRPVGEFDLHAYADRQLARQRCAAVGAWLAADPAAADRVADYAWQSEALRRLYGLSPGPPGPELQRLQLRLALDLGRCIAEERRRRARSRGPAAMLLSAGALGGLLAFGTLVADRLGIRPGRAARPSARAAAGMAPPPVAAGARPM